AAAAHGRHCALLRDRVARAARPRELRRRVPRAARRIRRSARRHGARRERADLRRGLLARADPAIVPRRCEERDPRDGFRSARDGVVRSDDRRARLARREAPARPGCGETDARGARRRGRDFRRGGRAVTFTAAHFVALLPIVVLGAAAMVVLLLAAFSRLRRVTIGATALGLAATLATLPIAPRVIPLHARPPILADGAALVHTGLLAPCTLGVPGLSTAYLRSRGESAGELCILLVTAALGAAVLSASAHFASLFLGIELVSVSLFALLAYARDEKPNLEASLKYVILSGVSSAFLLFGIALVYTELGTLEFARIAELVPLESASSVYIAGGLGFVIAGIAFKMSLVPFHLWTRDVYQGAPAPITAFLATVSKGAVFVVLLRYFVLADAYAYRPLIVALSLLAGASMLLGNVLALLQNNVKRILAYSSIAHIGYLLVAFIAGGAVAIESASYYLAAYLASSIGAFGVVAILSSGVEGETQTLREYRGLYWRRPWLAAVFSLMLLSLAGIPLTMGFVAKFYVVAASIEASLWVLLALVIVGSGIGLFYYLRVLVTLYLEPDDAALEHQPARVSAPGHAVLAAATRLVLWLCIFPAQLIDLVRRPALGLGRSGGRGHQDDTWHRGSGRRYTRRTRRKRSARCAMRRCGAGDAEPTCEESKY